MNSAVLLILVAIGAALAAIISGILWLVWPPLAVLLIGLLWLMVLREPDEEAMYRRRERRRTKGARKSGAKH